MLHYVHVFLGLLLGAVSSSAALGQTLWQNIEAGMTVEQVRALYPEGRTPDKRHVEHHAKLTELHGYLQIGKCRPRVEIRHPDGVVTGVFIWMRPQGLRPMCADEARSAVLSKFGEPLTVQSKNFLPGDFMHGDQETLTWARDGVTVSFFREKRDNAWHIFYDSVGSQDAAGL